MCRRRERQSGGFRTLWQGLWRSGGEAAAPASVTVAPPVAVARSSATGGGGRGPHHTRRRLFPDPAHLVRDTNWLQHETTCADLHLHMCCVPQAAVAHQVQMQSLRCHFLLLK